MSFVVFLQQVILFCAFLFFAFQGVAEESLLFSENRTEFSLDLSEKKVFDSLFSFLPYNPLIVLPSKETSYFAFLEKRFPKGIVISWEDLSMGVCGESLPVDLLCIDASMGGWKALMRDPFILERVSTLYIKSASFFEKKKEVDFLSKYLVRWGLVILPSSTQKMSSGVIFIKKEIYDAIF